MNRALFSLVMSFLLAFAASALAAEARQFAAGSDTGATAASSSAIASNAAGNATTGYVRQYSSSWPWYGTRRYSGYYTYRPRMSYEREIEHGAYSTSNSRYGFPLGMAITGGFADVAAYPVGNGNPYAYQSPWYWNPMNANSQVTSPNPYPFQYPYAYPAYPYGGYPYGGYGSGYGGYPPPGAGLPYGGYNGNWSWSRQPYYSMPGGYPSAGGYGAAMPGGYPSAGGYGAAMPGGYPSAGGYGYSTPGGYPAAGGFGAGGPFPSAANAGSFAPSFAAPLGGPQAFGGGNGYLW